MTAQTILPANSVVDSGYDVANSVRFNDDDGAYMHKTPDSAGNRKTWTFSCWSKKSESAAHSSYFGANNSFQLEFHSTGAMLAWKTGGDFMLTNALFRDTSAWYHIVWAFDTTQGTAANRVKLYINGTQVTSWATASYPDEDAEFDVNNAVPQYVGDYHSGSSENMDGYLAEVVFIDGLALAADQFGEFDSDSGIWKPIDVSGLTFGTNGFYLDFQASGNLGNDANGGTDLTEVNLAATDQSTDTCTNNFATLNPLDVGDKDGRTLSEGNLDFTTSSGNNGHISGTLAVSGSGKWYFETKILAQSGTASSSAKFGIIGIRNINESSPGVAGNSYYVYSDGRKEDGDNTTNSAHPGYVLNDIVQVALDLDNGNVYFGLNGDWGDNDGNFDEAFVDATAFFGSINTNGFWTIYLNKNVTADNVLTLSANFGSPSFAISSGNTDGNGYGNFEYAVPSGYFSLCTKNLAEYG